MRLVRAEGSTLEQILDETHPLWGEGLTRQRYGQYNDAQLRTPWGTRRLSRVALVDGDRVLASAKRYDLRLGVEGRSTPAVGIGAVFTSPALRGRGYAARLIEELMASARAGGAAMAVLFSEIGSAYYQRLGFTVVPIRETTIAVRQPGGAPAIMLRSGDERDLAMVATIHNEMGKQYRLALEYDPEWAGYTLAKKRLLAGFGEPGRTRIEFFVVEEGGRAAAWLVVHVTRRRSESGPDTWTVHGCGDRDASGARVGAMLQVLLAREPADALPVIRGWWPDRFTPPQVVLDTQLSTSPLMMLRPLAVGAPSPSPSEADVLYWLGDAF